MYTCTHACATDSTWNRYIAGLETESKAVAINNLYSSSPWHTAGGRCRTKVLRLKLFFTYVMKMVWQCECHVDSGGCNLDTCPVHFWTGLFWLVCVTCKVTFLDVQTSSSYTSSTSGASGVSSTSATAWTLATEILQGHAIRSGWATRVLTVLTGKA